MKRFLLTAAVLVFAAASAQAGPLARLFGRGQCQPVQTAGYGWGGVSPPVQSAPADGVQWKADVQAQAGRMHHPGGGFVPGASYEGVGYSSASPQDALARCCNNGGPVVAEAVQQGPGGWYAVRQYGQPGPVVQAVGGVLTTTGQVIQTAGGVVQSVGSGLRPTCSNGVCR